MLLAFATIASCGLSPHALPPVCLQIGRPPRLAAAVVAAADDGYLQQQIQRELALLGSLDDAAVQQELAASGIPFQASAGASNLRTMLAEVRARTRPKPQQARPGENINTLEVLLRSKPALAALFRELEFCDTNALNAAKEYLLFPDRARSRYGGTSAYEEMITWVDRAIYDEPTGSSGATLVAQYRAAREARLQDEAEARRAVVSSAAYETKRARASAAAGELARRVALRDFLERWSRACAWCVRGLPGPASARRVVLLGLIGAVLGGALPARKAGAALMWAGGVVAIARTARWMHHRAPAILETSARATDAAAARAAASAEEAAAAARAYRGSMATGR